MCPQCDDCALGSALIGRCFLCRKKGWKAHVDKFLKSALQFLGSATGMAVLAVLAVLVLLGVYGNRPQGIRV